jgi:hypothetical protein
VDKNLALNLRECILIKLVKEFGPRESPKNTWAKVVDITVFKENGLRMLGSR